MNDRGTRRWALLGALVSAALLAPACDRKVPEAGSDYEGRTNNAQDRESFINEEQGSQPATGGSGLQQQQPQQGDDSSIGAPGYSDPRELPRTDQGVELPPPDQFEQNQHSYRRGEEKRDSPPSE